jgi:purine-binding chemotaxis protein CheW
MTQTLRDRVDAAASREAQTESRDAKRDWLVFQVGAHRIAVPSDSVVEVTSVRPVHPIPHTPAHILGVFTLRSMPVPLFDLTLLLSENRQTPARRYVLLQHEDLLAGVTADQVIGFAVVAENDLHAPLPEMARLGPFVTGQFIEGDALTATVDVARLLDHTRTRG